MLNYLFLINTISKKKYFMNIHFTHFLVCHCEKEMEVVPFQNEFFHFLEDDYKANMVINHIYKSLH